MVEPVGRRDANLDALGIGNSECLEDRQIAAEVVRRTDIRPDGLTFLTERRCCWRKWCCKAVGVEVLILEQVLARIANDERLEAVFWLAGTDPLIVSDSVGLVATNYTLAIHGCRRNRQRDRGVNGVALRLLFATHRASRGWVVDSALVLVVVHVHIR